MVFLDDSLRCKKILLDYVKCENRRLFFNDKIYCKNIYNEFVLLCLYNVHKNDV